ncbi:MAG: hypothetical protein LBM75_08335 [Myxococcales bacterium]|jgi:hypothetical protein|nr:hypothetical protein [Myxococcales bacterium]
MRIATVAFALLFLATLTCAWQLPNPAWIAALYVTPVFGVLAITGGLLFVFELMLGPNVRAVAPAVAIALGLFAALFVEFEEIFLLFANAEALPLDRVGGKLLASGTAGAALSAIWLGGYGLRASYKASQIASVVALTLAVYALAFIPEVLQVSFPAPWMCALFTLTAAFVALVSWPSREASDAGTAQDS